MNRICWPKVAIGSLIGTYTVLVMTFSWLPMPPASETDLRPRVRGQYHWGQRNDDTNRYRMLIHGNQLVSGMPEHLPPEAELELLRTKLSVLEARILSLEQEQAWRKIVPVPMPQWIPPTLPPLPWVFTNGHWQITTPLTNGIIKTDVKADPIAAMVDRLIDQALDREISRAMQKLDATNQITRAVNQQLDPVVKMLEDLDNQVLQLNHSLTNRSSNPPVLHMNSTSRVDNITNFVLPPRTFQMNLGDNPPASGRGR